MSTYDLRQALVEIAGKEVGTIEAGRNTGKRIREYQAATDLGGTGWPWCAAFVCWCIKQWGKNPAVREALKKNISQYETWRPKTAAAFGFEDWARKRGLMVMGETAKLHTGDIIVFDMSHVGIVATDDEKKTIWTIEGNTGPSGGREGDGVWNKVRQRKEARSFIRILD